MCIRDRVKAVQAGVDMILMPQNFEEAYQGILEAVHQGTISEERIDASIKRILEVKMNETSNLKTGDSSERQTADRTTNYTGDVYKRQDYGRLPFGYGAGWREVRRSGRMHGRTCRV